MRISVKKYISLVIIFILLNIFLSIPIYAQNTSKTIVYGAEIDASSLPTIQYTFNVINTNGSDSFDTSAPSFNIQNISLNINEQQTLKPITEATRKNIPLSVVFVLDTSVMMNELNTPPNSSRFDDSVENINTLLRKLPDESNFSLITFDSEVQSVVLREKDKNIVRNALVSIERTNIESEEYPLAQAIKQGLEQFRGELYNPLALFVFTAGKPNTEIDDREISSSLLSMSDNPPAITFINYGSDQDGQYQKYPANLGSLERLAISLQAQSLRFFALDNQQLLNASDILDQRISVINRRSIYYVIQFSTDTIDSGLNILTFNVDNTISTRKIEVGIVAPKIAVEVPTTVLSGTVPLKSTILFRQSPIEKIEYFLNNTRVGESKNATDNYSYNLDVANLKQFIPNKSYELFAAATYTDNGVAKTERSPIITVQLVNPVVVPVAARSIPWIWIAGGLLGLFVIGIITTLFVRRNSSKYAPAHSSSSLQPSQPSDPDETIDVSSPRANMYEQTQDFFGGDHTQDFFATTRLPTMYKIVFKVNNTVIEEILRKYITTIGRIEGNDIVIASPYVSSEHAQIMIENDTIYVLDRDSTNGVFLQEHQPMLKHEAIAANQKVRVELDKPFWIGTQVQAVIHLL